jgi:DamX protein
LAYVRQGLEASGITHDLDAASLRTICRRGRGLPGHINRLVEDALSGTRPRIHFAGRELPPVTPQVLGWSALIGAVLIMLGFLSHALFWPESAADRVADTAADRAPTIEPSATANNQDERTPAVPDVVEKAPATVQTPSATAASPAAAVPAPASTTVPATSSASDSDAAPPALDSEPGSTDLAWMQAQRPDFYTVQLINLPDRIGAQAFIERHPLAGTTVAVEVRRGAGTRYLVLHESYANAAAARRAIADLPPELRRNEPFPRRFQSVQPAMVGR